MSTDEASAATSSPPDVVESIIYSFCSQLDTNIGACLDGQSPNGVIQGSDGNFYGTTGPMGIASGGTMFKLTPSGTLTTLHQFCPQQDPNRGGCLDGAGPGPVIEGEDGNFYGTAAAGGANVDRGGLSAGTVFEVTPSGTLTTLYSFCPHLDPKTDNCLDGENPVRIVEGSDGNFYGITYSGGPYAFGGARPAGTVFMLTSSGMLTTIYSFCGQIDESLYCLDGEAPNSLIQGSDGNFYGTTSIGGQYGSNTSGGTVFEITPDGVFATLYSFCNRKDPSTLSCLDGTAPSGLIQGSDGNFYGTTVSGGANGGGTVFRLTPSGTLTTLYSFCSRGPGNCTDGVAPEAGVIEGSDGNFYGTTFSGGATTLGGVQPQPAGTVFMLTPSGKLTTFYSFCGELNPNVLTDCLDGANPDGIVEGGDGNFYGTTVSGGANGAFGYGTLFKLGVSFPALVPSGLTISPGGRSFGNIPLGTTRDETFLVRAQSSGKSAAPILLESFTIRGSDYWVDQTLTTCKQGQMLQSRQKCEIVVDFSPSLETKRLTDIGTLNVISNAEKVLPKNGVVTLRGGGKR